MIQLRLTDIPSQGTEITDVISQELLNERMNEAPKNDIEFLNSPSFTISAKTTQGGVELQGEISGKYQQPCGRCLEPLEHLLESKLHLHLKPKDSQPGLDRATTSEEWQDGVGIIYFKGEHIDLEEILQENLILSLSPFNSDHEGCPGIEEIEKNNDPEEKLNSLGALLKDALKE